jgi:hypothetical protein
MKGGIKSDKRGPR